MGKGGTCGRWVVVWWMASALTAMAEAPPVEFGLEEVRRAIAEKGLSRSRIRIQTEIGTGDPETYRIAGARVSGGDLRGLMYGLFEAADQLRVHGRLTPAAGKPATPIRGVRRFLHNQEQEEDWYYSRDYWLAYIRMLARNRFNRLNLVFAHQTNYLAPPYPYWVEVKEFPDVRAPGLTAESRARNLETLCYIAQTAADHAIDFTLGVWQHDAQQGRQDPVVEGLHPGNLGPYSYSALKQVLAACPAVRSVQVRTNWESGIPAERQVEFYRDYVYRALRETGRLVTLDLRGWLMSEGMLDTATGSGVPMRLSSKYWAEHLGRPYQPPETVRNYSYIDFLRKQPANGLRTRPYDFFWEVWALGSHRLFLWGDPDYVKRAVPTFALSGSKGFEIDAPLAQKGYGNRPGKWGILAAGQGRREFWKRDFERYWLFYMLWGRLAYDPKTPERIWRNELKRRFGGAADDVLEAYGAASRILSEIVAVNMPDPNMYMWPEINPGGLIDFYRQTPPSDPRLVASFEEAARDRLEGNPSAKQTPEETAARLRAWAGQAEAASSRAASKLAPDHREWLGTAPDFAALARLARYHAHKQLSAIHLELFYRTSTAEELERSRSEAAAAARVWEELVRTTEGVYPPAMSYGPEDAGHWRDKLPYLRQDLKTLDERWELLNRFGRCERAFDFGGGIPSGSRLPARYLRPYAVEPRFEPVEPGTAYTDDRGYGWLFDGERRASEARLPSRETLRATAASPADLPGHALYGDWIRGRGPQLFRVRIEPGNYVVSVLDPEGAAVIERPLASEGALDIAMPEGEWRVSGIVVRSPLPAAHGVPARAPERGPRPAVTHFPPKTAKAGAALPVRLTVAPGAKAAKVRLHYKPLSQLEPFRTLEAPAAQAAFTIPGEDLTAERDLLYYFEILDRQGSGWFHPNPDTAAPYLVVEVVPGA